LYLLSLAAQGFQLVWPNRFKRSFEHGTQPPGQPVRAFRFTPNA
jgi:hypothetical protein